MRRIIFLLCSIVLMSCKIAAQTINNLGNIDSESIKADTPLASTANFEAKRLPNDMLDVILGADSIVAHVCSLEDESIEDIVLGCCEAYLVKYLLCEPSMYKSDKIVYGMFSEFATITFHANEQYVKAVFDYGLSKWQVHSSNGETVLQCDMPKGTLLTLFHTLFNESKLIGIVYDQYCSKP